MKPPSVPAEEKWSVGGRAEAPAAAVVPADASRPGDGASAWVPSGQRRRFAPAPVEPSERQRLAVEAYCRELCVPTEAPAATTEALAAFSVTAARLGSRATVDDHTRVLSRATRLAAASHALVGAGGSGWRSRLSDALTAERDVGCRNVPGLLARRANGELAANDAAALRDHLRDCLRCRASEVRAARAERTFAATARLGVTPPGVTGIAAAAAVSDAAVAEASMTGPEPVVAGPEPVVAGPEPVVAGPEPVVAGPEPVVAGPEPVVAGPEPVVAGPETTWIPAPATPDADPTPDAEATPPASPPRLRRRLTGPVPVAAAVGLLAACGVAAATVLNGASAHHVATAATASTHSTPLAATPVAAARVHKPHHRRVVHHRPHKPKPKPKPAPVRTTVTSRTATSTGNTGTGNTGAVGSTGNTGALAPASSSVGSSAPVASSPAPAASSGGGGNSGGGSKLRRVRDNPTAEPWRHERTHAGHRQRTLSRRGSSTMAGRQRMQGFCRYAVETLHQLRSLSPGSGLRR